MAYTKDDSYISDINKILDISTQDLQTFYMPICKDDHTENT